MTSFTPGQSSRRLVDGGLEFDFLAAAPSPIGGDDDGGAEILNAGLQRFGGESAEHDAVNDAQPAHASMAMGSSGTIGM